mmetsp:Transcript_23422/g.61319  ORF Transcript_23422/g.61319 Transcript_23422/m.61319 type:complete len:456 (-) Transcript_23422:182-1549(-)
MGKIELVNPPLHALTPESAGFETAVFPVKGHLVPLKPEPFDFRDVAHPLFFVLLVIVGATLSIEDADDSEGISNVLGAILFAAGLTPAVIYSWSFFLGYGLRRTQDLLRALSSATIMAVGAGMMNSGSGESYELFAAGLFEIGVLFFVEKFFFLAGDEEKIIKALRLELHEALRSPGTGMAMSYFYNFVLPTASCLAGDHPDIDMEKSRGVFEDYTLSTPTFFIFIPRTLDGTDLKKALSDGTRSGMLRMGKPRPPKDSDRPHRPMFMYFLQSDPERGTCDGMCDFPTIISSCWDRMEDRKARHVQARASAVESPDGHIDDRAFSAVSESRTRVNSIARLRRTAREPLTASLGIAEEEGLDVTIPKELRDFQNALLDLVLSNPITAQSVQIVSIPAPPLDFSSLSAMLHDLRSPRRLGANVNDAALMKAVISPSEGAVEEEAEAAHAPRELTTAI